MNQQVKTWLRTMWWRSAKHRFPQQADGKTLLHIGCGQVNSPGYINIDARKFPHVHIVTRKITSLPLFPSDQADLIYMCHVLEHVKRGQVIAVLSEMRRILKTGGVLRLSVPDFDRIVEIYNATQRSIDAIQGPLMGGQDYDYNFHHLAFNAEHLRKLLLSCGYREVRAWDPDNCQYHDFQDWASMRHSYGEEKFEISLNLEAVK